jgi:glycosyltransferase involved in cell wall biosynthesis
MQNFSLLMSVYKNDKSQWLRECFDSIFNNTVLPSEIVLVIDGEIPDILETEVFSIENNQQGIPVKIIRRGWQGLAGARRGCIEDAQYDIVAVMDADDICVPNRFERQLQAFKKDADLSVCGGQIEEFVEGKGVIGIRKMPLSDKEIKKYFKKRQPVNHMTSMMKKKDIIEAGNYLDWWYDEDYYLFARMLLNGCKFENVEEVLCKVRVDENWYKRRGGKKIFLSEYHLQIFFLQNHIINLPEFWFNVFVRFIVQICLPNNIRSWIFKVLFRAKKV